jgi:hypothetical protein
MKTIKLTKSINTGKVVIPAGAEIKFSNEGVGYFQGQKIEQDLIPLTALEAFSADDLDETVKLINKKSKNPGFTFYGPTNKDCDAFNKMWKDKNYVDALGLLANQKGLMDFDDVKDFLGSKKVGKESLIVT